MSGSICAITIIASIVVFFLVTILCIGEDKETRSLMNEVAKIIIIVIVVCGCFALNHIEITYENIDENVEITSVRKLENDDGTSYIITTKDDNEYCITHAEYATCNGHTAPSVEIIESKTDEYKITGSTTYRIESIFGHSMKEEKAYDVIVEVPSDVYNIYKYGNNAQLTDVKL